MSQRIRRRLGQESGRGVGPARLTRRAGRVQEARTARPTKKVRRGEAGAPAACSALARQESRCYSALGLALRAAVVKNSGVQRVQSAALCDRLGLQGKARTCEIATWKSLRIEGRLRPKFGRRTGVAPL